MKILSILSLFCLHQTFSNEVSVMQQSVLKQYENFYEMIKPAEENSDEAYVWFCDIPHWLFNGAFHLCSENVAKKVDAVIAKAPVGHPISFWLHPLNQSEGLEEILKEKGFTPIITCPLMSRPVTPIECGNWDIRPADLDLFLTIVDTVYQLGPSVMKEYEKVMRTLEGENYLIYEDNIPVGTATLLVNGSVGGIFNDATLADRREASKPMTQFLMKRAHELGLKQLILLSSPEGEQLYENLGFKNVLNIEIYARF